MHIRTPSFSSHPLPSLPPEEVHLWRLDLEKLANFEPQWLEVLSAEERRRAQNLRFPWHRQHFVAVHAILRVVLAGYLEVDPKTVAFQHSARGKPSLAPPHAESQLAFNLSHSGDLALFAITRGRELGVDVERIREDIDVQQISRCFFSSFEQEALASVPQQERYKAFFRCWTRKEAYIKAVGEGLSVSLDQFDVSIDLCNQAANALLATRHGSLAAKWFVREVPAGTGYVAALCVSGRGWRLRDWTEATNV